MCGKNFSLFSMNLGANSVPSFSFADILGAVDDAQVPALVEIARVAGMHPAVFRLGVVGRLGFLKYSLNTPGLR